MAFKDSASATDHVEAGLSTSVVAPEHPCPSCGKAMKDARSKEDREAGLDIRICSVKTCETNGQRTQADWTSGSAVLMGPPSLPN